MWLGILIAWQLASNSVCSKWEEIEGARHLRLESVNWHSVTSVLFYWSSSDRIHLELNGGREMPLLSGRRIKESVIVFTLPECLLWTLCLVGALLNFPILHSLLEKGYLLLCCQRLSSSI